MILYYYVDPLKTRKGPFTLQELRTLKATGVIDDSTALIVDGGNKEIRLPDLEKIHAASAAPSLPSATQKQFDLAPPLSSSPTQTSREFKIPLALIGIPLVLAVILALLAAGGLLFWFGTTPKFSAGDDEIQSPAKRTSDFMAWRTQIQTLSQGGSLIDGTAPRKVSWWTKRQDLPPDAAAEAVLRRKLPSDVELGKIQLLNYQIDNDATSMTYAVTVRPKQGLFLVSTAPVKLSDPAFKNYQNLAKYVIAAPDLPAGQAYNDSSKKIIGERNADFTFTWSVRRAVKSDGVWKILDSGPTPFEINPRLEQELRAQDGPQAPVIRPESVLAQAAQQQTEITANLIQRIGQIDAAVANYRSQAYANVPGQAVKDNSKFGGSGSGEPTKTGVRVLGGAGGGAAVGALAGGGEGAGWGALGGAIIGGVYDAVSKSNDKKKFEAQKQARYQAQVNARASAQRQAANAVAAYQKSLMAELETELKTAAENQNARLGVTPPAPAQPTIPATKAKG